MKSYFDNLISETKEKFLKGFENHINNALEKASQFPNTESLKSNAIYKRDTILSRHKETTSLNYYYGNLNNQGVDNLIFPHHYPHKNVDEPIKDSDKPVKAGGKLFHEVINDYLEDYMPNSRFNDCVEKAKSQQSYFFKENDKIISAEFLFVSNVKEFSIPNDYDDSHGKGKIYIGPHFHRFLAYGLWINQYRFKPLEVYYCEKKEHDW